jgi:hypothetical protein
VLGPTVAALVGGPSLDPAKGLDPPEPLVMPVYALAAFHEYCELESGENVR